MVLYATVIYLMLDHTHSLQRSLNTLSIGSEILRHQEPLKQVPVETDSPPASSKLALIQCFLQVGLAIACCVVVCFVVVSCCCLLMLFAVGCCVFADDVCFWLMCLSFFG